MWEKKPHNMMFKNIKFVEIDLLLLNKMLDTPKRFLHISTFNTSLHLLTSLIVKTGDLERNVSSAINLTLVGQVLLTKISISLCTLKRMVLT